MSQLPLTKEAAEILRVSEEYLRELIRAGKLKAYKEGRRGGYRGVWIINDVGVYYFSCIYWTESKEGVSKQAYQKAFSPDGYRGDVSSHKPYPTVAGLK